MSGELIDRIQELLLQLAAEQDRSRSYYLEYQTMRRLLEGVLNGTPGMEEEAMLVLENWSK
jgi:hypothetical protein